MLRDFKFLRRNSSKNEEIENVPVNPRDSSGSQSTFGDSSSRPPLNTINPKIEQEALTRARIDRTPTKPVKPKNSDHTLPLRTPDKHGVSYSSKHRFGWANKNESSTGSANELRDDFRSTMTPRGTRAAGRATPSYSESNSTQSTPTKSVSKPPNSGFRSKFDWNGNGNVRAGNFAALYKGIPSSGGQASVVNTVEVPHFDLKEDPSFWMDHSVQVLLRVRPLNSMEKSTQGYTRCLKQESAQSITWIGQPETRFTFDHVACETVDQEMIFRMAGLQMVENCLSGYNSCMFAYGQTGSGKTHTMLGEIEDLEVRPSPHRGMTPRIFEFLFARIQAEEESRRDEKLKYNCKCSFLEIYNEQITDLLDPSSTNLMLREDVKKGVYVENLSEFEVQTVGDILKLLTQGSLNRKVAATNMNRESSRSHSVFTCVIESRWEKDSTTNLRFARLNLVDLAGSERQKTSGAEGERLKEAASINKSLSTLGHVIMILVDLAHGKPKHVPYRDSRLTFLLQDSLGGNSKTMIIANVSPSICCAAETLNTLKFAQRAKLIQNNAVVNEDSTGDVNALQHQIRLLKEELLLLKRQNISRSLSFGSMTDLLQAEESACMLNKYGMDQQPVDLPEFESKGIVRLSTKQLKSLETTLAGALRREQMAETSIKKLEAEIEQLNRLVRQREEDTRSSKMMLRFREDKIQRMESLLGGSLPADSFLMEENRALSEEMQLLQAKVDKNPEVTRFALENIRLLDQIRRFEEFYEEGEREILMAEVSKLRDQLLQFLDGNSMQHNDSKDAVRISKENNSLQSELKTTLGELEKCKNNLNSCIEENAKLSREINDLHSMLNNLESVPDCQKSSAGIIEGMLGAPTFELSVQNAVEEMHATQVMKHAEEIMHLQLELDILKIIINEERSSRAEVEGRETCFSRDLELANDQLLLLKKQYEDVSIELKEAKSVIEALESQQILSISEMEDLRKSNWHYVKRLREEELEIIALKEQISGKELRDNPSSDHFKSQDLTLQAKLKRMHDSLDKAKRLNMWYQNDHVSNEEEMDEIHRQVEAETAEVIVCMQEELSILQQQVQDYHLKEMETGKNVMLLETELKELQEKLALSTEKNEWLLEKLEEKDEELRTLSEEWELMAGEVEEVLAHGHDTLIDASDQLDLISISFPQKRVWISEQVGRLISIISEKEFLIEELGRYLEDASNKRCEVDCMLKSLRGAALVINEAHQQECNEKEQEILLLLSKLRGKTSTIAQLEDKMKMAEDRISKMSVCATAAFVIVNRQSETTENNLISLKHKDIQLKESAEMNLEKDALLTDQAALIDEAEKQIQSLRKEVTDLEETCAQLGKKLSEEEQRANAIEQKLEDNDILKTREKLSELKAGVSTLRSCVGLCLEDDKISGRYNADGDCSSFDGSGEGRSDAETNKDDVDVYFVEDLRADYSKHCFKTRKSSCSYSYDQKLMESGNGCKDVHERDATIVLLRLEIESALKSLKEVQAEMTKLHGEKEEMLVSKKQNEQGMKCLVTQLLTLQATVDDFEKQSELKMEAVNRKLGEFEQIVHEAGTDWYQTKEILEHEVGDAKVIAVQKAAEASCIFAKFEEAQDTMKDADIMINGLLIANETLKLDKVKLKQTQVKLKKERNSLINEVQSLQSINDLKDQQLENLEKQYGSNLTETRDLVVELEGLVADVQTTFRDTFVHIAHDFQCMKSELLDSTNLVRSWLDDVWSEIIVKDCAVAVLHLCHMGILLETVTGLNAENGLLQHGLSESNSAIADLKDHNFKSRRELEMCRVLKGKLLADIKNSFDRISRKEEETGEISVKLITFEKKVSDLQLQEEMMFQRSNYMGSQLSVLMNELDSSNINIVASLLDQEKLQKDKEEVLKSEAELLMVDLCSKDFESLVLASELEEMALQKAEAERKNIHSFAVIENLKKELIVCNVDAELKEELYSLVLHDLEERKSKFKSSLSRIDTSEMENHRLKDKIWSLEACIGNLQTDLEMKNAELSELQHSQADFMEDLCLKNRDLEFNMDRISTLTEENASLRNNITHLKNDTHKAMSILSMDSLKCLDSVKSVEMMGSRLFNKMHEGFMISDTMFQEICENAERLSKFTKDFESLECHVEELMSENKTLQAELSRKDDVLEGLSFDLSLLQESASNTKDQKDEIEEMVASLEALEDDLELKSSELDLAVTHREILESQLLENINVISTLESNISRGKETLKLLSCENMELRSRIEDTLAAKTSIQEELTKRVKINKSLELEVEEMGNALGQMNDTIESLRSHLNELTSERDHLHLELLSLNERLEREQLRAEENEASALESQQLAESRKIYADEKEVEVRLLERSVEELERTINVLENKVDIIKEEAERQRLQREDLELELNSLNHQMQNVEDADANTKRHLNEKEKNLQEALKQIHILERDIANRDAEIAQCKAHISELNLHAEAQASEYKQKFKALESMVEQVRADGPSTQVTNSSSNKVERNASKHKGSGSPLNALKPRGSGSPFKCIGLGLAQQMKSEKDEELTVSRMRIEELESLAVSRQKEIFTLKARLASAESMTHDVIRDLLGVKLDMTHYASLMDNQQVHKITEKARLNVSESQVKDQEVIKLKQQLNEFIEERRGWLEEIDRKQAELVAAQIALETHRQQDQSLRTENEMLKMENVKYKKMVMELDEEVKKLSGQQNIHQRIHHHAKIKEENNMLKYQNEDLITKLRRSEVFLSRVKEELVQYRTSIGKNPYINFDEEHRLNNKLQETEEERLQLAQKLLGLCTSILKAAGITRVATDISHDVAEEALEQLTDRIISQDRELQNLKFKIRINNERNRLSEIIAQSSPTNTRTDDNIQSPTRRVSQAPSYLSALDR
ncbi:hypothetical protein Ddye_003746 [Dipteronia dyeriana]|uniref:Kinesin motor domain-containing protein n=1 Tax=Dipteronia dyeriana TaxID=168575 RepID=A0AAE0CVK9_9ROSI|nr:hypothetical protein Ddye_003746 [Dipteronia dyeriana]